MPAGDVRTGFFGKMPATGDFVTRRLPHDFVQNWDRWISGHLVPLQTAGTWAEGVGLRFLLGPDAMGPMAGVVLPSADRIGRRFPLTLAAPFGHMTAGFLAAAGAWFDILEAAAAAAIEGTIGADDLAAELGDCSVPAVPAGPPVQGMVFATAVVEPVAVDQDAPRRVLERLLLVGSEIP